MECFDLQNMTMANRALAQASRHTSTELDRIDDAQLAWKLMTDRNWNDVDEFASDCDVCIRRLGRITPWKQCRLAYVCKVSQTVDVLFQCWMQRCWSQLHGAS